jgi:RimJ/RimL family protein N-acetyltransferase
VSGRLAGAASLMARIGPGGLELGYWLHPDHVGQGVATRASSLLVAEAFRTGAERVEIVTDVANTRSAAIPRRLGFTLVDRRPPQEPVTPGEDGLDVIWRLRP